MINPLTRLRVGGSMDISLLTRIIEELNSKVEKLELQVKLFLPDTSETQDETIRKPKVSKSRRKTNKDS
jgi:hypothetical protein